MFANTPRSPDVCSVMMWNSGRLGSDKLATRVRDSGVTNGRVDYAVYPIYRKSRGVDANLEAPFC